MPMHDSTRDQILDAMVSQGWANQSDGNVDASTGHFARVSNEPADIGNEFGGIMDAFKDEAYLEIPEDYDWAELVGHFLVLKDSAGFLTVIKYDSEAELVKVYRDLESAYSDWLGPDDDEIKTAYDDYVADMNDDFALSDCRYWVTNQMGNCGGRVELVDGQPICENCRNRPTYRRNL